MGLGTNLMRRKPRPAKECHLLSRVLYTSDLLYLIATIEAVLATLVVLESTDSGEISVRWFGL